MPVALEGAVKMNTTAKRLLNTDNPDSDQDVVLPAWIIGLANTWYLFRSAADKNCVILHKVHPFGEGSRFRTIRQAVASCCGFERPGNLCVIEAEDWQYALHDAACDRLLHYRRD